MRLFPMLGLPRFSQAWIVASTDTCTGVSAHGQLSCLFIGMLSRVRGRGGSSEASPLLPRSRFGTSEDAFREVRFWLPRSWAVLVSCGFYNKTEHSGELPRSCSALPKRSVRSFGTVCLRAFQEFSFAHRDNDSAFRTATHAAMSVFCECSCVRPTALGHLNHRNCDCA